MDKSNIKINILYFLTFLVIFFMCVLTYAHIKKNNITNEDEDKINITYNDTSNIAIINALKDEEILKTFTIKNISNETIYYDVFLDNLVNNYQEEAIIYSLDSEDVNSAFISDTYLENNTKYVISNFKLESNKEHKYNLKFKVLNSDGVNKTLSANINVSLSKNNNIYSKNTLLFKLLNNNSVLNEKEISNENNEGLFYTNNSIDGKTIYYFRGSNNLKNNLIINDTCYKIVRTTEENGIRIIYNGKLENGICNENNIIEESEFNLKSNYNAYVGYMYGKPDSNSYNQEHENINSSKIKTIIDSFYLSNFNHNFSIIENSIYCANRKTSSFTINNVSYGTYGYKNYNSGYESTININNLKPSFKCSEKNDRLSIPTLSNPIATITAQEAMYAGINDKNTNNYLNSKYSYWTMSPSYFNGTNAYNYIIKDGKLLQSKVNDKHGIRPVVTLLSTVKFKSGDGSEENPYNISY